MFWINERGKTRKIQAQKINERILQRTLCDNVIVPLYDNSFIYDNAANRVGKGIEHTLNRINCHMQRHFRKYGLNGWIVTCDFRDFFNGQKRFGLGPHTSQKYTNIAVTPLDHYIKDKLRVKEYGRYVDDFYFFTETKEQAIELLDKIRKKVNELGLELNEKKTRLQKFSSGFKFLKIKFFCTNTGKIIRKVDKKSAIRMKRKLKKFNRWINEGSFTKEQATNAYYSWRGYMKRGNSYRILKKMDEYKLNLIGK